MVQFVPKELHVLTGKSCYFASLYTMLHYYGISVSEAELFFLSNSMHFEFNEADIFNHDFTLGIFHTDNLFNTLEECFDCTITSMEQFASEECSQAIIKNQLPILFIRSSALYYHERHYQLDGIEDTHTVLLYGIDVDQSLAYIADSYIIGNNGEVISYQGEFPLQVLKENVIKMVFFQIQSENRFNKAQLYKRITTNIDNFLQYHFSEGHHEGNFAIYKLFASLKDILNEQSSCSVKKIREVNYFISAHFINKIEYMIDLLRENSHLKTADAAEGLIDIKNKWIDFSTILFKESFRADTTRISGILDYGMDLVCKQEIILHNIKTLIDNRG